MVKGNRWEWSLSLSALWRSFVFINRTDLHGNRSIHLKVSKRLMHIISLGCVKNIRFSLLIERFFFFFPPSASAFVTALWYKQLSECMLSHARPNDRLQTAITSFPLNHTLSINRTASILKILLLICFYCWESAGFFCV